MSTVSKIKRALLAEKIMMRTAQRGRFISPTLRWQMKHAKKICRVCKKKVKAIEIHHRIPVCKGGKNTIDNLMRVCHECHKILDAEAQKP